MRFTYLGCVDHTLAFDRHGILRRHESGAIDPRRAACIPHASPARDAVPKIESAVSCIPEIDDQRDSHQLARPQRKLQEQ